MLSQLEVEWAPSYRPTEPTLLDNGDGVVTAESLGDGWYRLRLSATPSGDYLGFVDHVVHEPYLPPLDLNFEVNGVQVASSNDEVGYTQLGTFNADEAYSVRLHGNDDMGNLFNESRPYRAPGVELALQYFIDVESDGIYELAGGGQGIVDIQMQGAAEVVVVSGFVRHPPDGERANFGGAVNLPNEVPRLIETQVIDLDEDSFSVVVALDAVDADGDTLTYRVEWGDGNETLTDGRIAQHMYAEAFTDYDIRITVADHRGAIDQVILPVTFAAPPANERPTVSEVSLVTQDGHTVRILVSANDPENAELQYEVDWGDGEVTQGVSPVLSHTYEEDVVGPVVIRVTANDGVSISAVQTLAIELDAPEVSIPPEIQGIFLVEKNGFEVVVGLQAQDGNDDPLTFTIDWDDEGPSEQAAGPFVRHQYPDNIYRGHLVNVTVTDPAGETDQHQLRIEFVEPDANQAPTMESIAEIARDGLTIQLLATANDPDGDALSYTFDWNDETAETVAVGGLAEHQYADFGSYDVRVTVTDEDGASDEVVHRIDFLAPAANQPPSLDVLEVIRQTDFTIAVAAGASDPDGDPLTYTIDWGDLGAPTQNTAGVGQHVYPEGVFADYEITVTVRDSRGGRPYAQRQLRGPSRKPGPSDRTVHVLEQSGFDIPWRYQLMIRTTMPSRIA